VSPSEGKLRISVQEVVLETVDGPMPTYVATPDGPIRGGIVVVQEIFGVNSHMKVVTERIGAEGWMAVTPALYHRAGSPAPGYDELPKAKALLDALTAEEVLTDVDAALGYLERQTGIPHERAGIVGFCMGGSVSLYVAAMRSLGAAVTFYGGGLGKARLGMPALAEIGAQIRTPWLGFFGDLDRSIPVEEVERLRETSNEASVSTQIVRYADAGHGFSCDDRPEGYNEQAARDSCGRTFAFFEQYLEA
jgi:carboxymethylenebutenolidase